MLFAHLIYVLANYIAVVCPAVGECLQNVTPGLKCEVCLSPPKRREDTVWNDNF